ncbi:MAG TPA: coproporphyrinogen dehydrogenase HemZ [Pseudobacteroides sp.]|uniref:coproporphyrinogen dehydrogenase HemZ n=1 Tax=Pseudobacteroides sp. TaxID=1968840 RepID=UPI002F95ADB5
MIYVKLEGHDYKYQVEDVIRMFFYNEDIIYADTSPINFGGIFILSRVEEGEKIYIELWREGLKAYYAESKLGVICDDGNEHIKSHRYKKKIKMELKRQLYLAFEFITGKSMPWGILTGIRPAKIVHEMLDMKFSRNFISEKLKNYYMVKEEKAGVLLEVAGKERSILNATPPDAVSIYIGIPFCTTRCLYCSFTSNPIDRSSDIVKNYIDALLYEMEKTAAIIADKGWSVQSIYIGGGTPTSIDEESLKKLLFGVESTFRMDGLQEFTLEAGRPDSLNVEKLGIIKSSRVDRISINPQSMNDEVLEAIGRNHTAKDIEWAFMKARETGFDNINMDIIAGLPGETLSMFKASLERITQLSPDSLTVHTLSFKRGSKLIEDKNNRTCIDNRCIEDMAGVAADYASTMNMKPYYLYRQKNILGNLENIGYSTKGHESIYNIQIMEEKQPIIAMGAGAVTKMVFPEENRIERVFNVKSVTEYINRTDEMIARKESIIFG